MEIKNSLDWQTAEALLRYQLHQVKDPLFKRDADQMIRNLTCLVSDLSRLELHQRRSSSHSSRLVDAQLKIINDTIIDLEQTILFQVIAT